MARGQVWLETVIYTLVGLGLIALVLAIVAPRIADYRDSSVIEQTVQALNQLDGVIHEMAERGVGNARVVDFQLRRGTLTIDELEETIQFILDDSASTYSEPGTALREGSVTVLTNTTRVETSVTLKLNYNGTYNLTLAPGQTSIVTAAPTPYRFRFSYTEVDSSNTPVIEVNELSGRS